MRCEFSVAKVLSWGLYYSDYIAPVTNLISAIGVCHHQYADDSQVFIAINSDDIQTKLNLLREDCTAAVNNWFPTNGFSFNPVKSDVFLLGTAVKFQTI